MRIILLYFIIALFIGFLIIYVIAPPPKIVIKYPNLNNVGKHVYVDDNNVCYKYKKVNVSCPIDNTKKKDPSK